MIYLMIKYGFIILCSTYTTMRLTNQYRRIGFPRCVLWTVLFILQLALVVNTRGFSLSVAIFSMIISSVFVNKLVLKLDISLSIPATILSYGISYILYAGGILALVAIKFLIGDHSANFSPVAFVVIGIVQTFLSILLFRTRRLCHGLPFLQSSHRLTLGVGLSISLLIVVAIFEIKSTEQRIIAILFCLVLSGGFLLWYWSKNYLIREYLERVQKREQKNSKMPLALSMKKIGSLDRKTKPFQRSSTKTTNSSQPWNWP